jgi:anthranilate synthase component 1
MIYPDKTTYLRDAAGHTVIPVFEVLRAEFETPLSVYLKSGGKFLLESIERGENVGRYSIIACGQKARLTLRGSRILIRENGRTILDFESANPMEDIRAYFSKLKAPSYDRLPPFFGGAIGYLGYEAVQYFERIPVFPEDGGVPDAILVVPELVLIYDSVKRALVLIAATMPGPAAAEEYERAVSLINGMAARLAGPLPSAVFPRPE